MNAPPWAQSRSYRPLRGGSGPWSCWNALPRRRWRRGRGPKPRGGGSAARCAEAISRSAVNACEVPRRRRSSVTVVTPAKRSTKSPTTASRTAVTSAIRRAVQRSADTLVTASSVSAGRSSAAAAARLDAVSTAAAACSTSSSVPGNRLAKKVRQEAERRPTSLAVVPRDRDRHRNPTHVGPVTSPAAAASGVQRTARQTCRLPRALRNVLLQGQLRTKA